MNLTLNSRWSKNEDDRWSHLIVTISAPDDEPEAIASQIYLDIQLPEGVRIRHIGELPTDGHRNHIGIDVPDLAPGEDKHIVFRVKSRGDLECEISPELHLHWIDAASGDVLERHQTGTTMPTEPTGVDEELAAILATTKSKRRHRRPSMRGKEFMNSERYQRRSRHHQRGKGHLHRTIVEMQERIDQMERRMRRMQRRAYRQSEPGFRRSCGHRHHHMHGVGRRMGRMAHRAFSDSQSPRDDRHLDA